MNQDNPACAARESVRWFDDRGIGVVVLNRPEALNALSLDMIEAIAAALERWRNDPDVRAVMFVGAGERAFCAGGDIKAFYYAGQHHHQSGQEGPVPGVFFAHEYALNRQIFHYPKPAIAVMNGITMGGGYGIAGHCRYRIATERTVFAMPEVGIGFYPDVGSVFHLLRAPNFYGHYLALTGLSINGSEMVHARLADYFVNSSKIKELKDFIYKSDDVYEAILRFADPVPDSAFLVAYSAEIADVFCQDSPEKMITNLAASRSVLAQRALEALRQKSPTSIKVTCAYLQRAAGMNFDEIIATDLILTQNFIQKHDFYEGIRAQVIDKDKNPRWSPASLSAVLEADIERYFRAPEHNNPEDVQALRP
jgi:enoyl-CoA hydratase